ncbi:HAD-like protein [Polychaeton citri CBS 116435]|uniref:Mitochondrial import inner membrane translocase subunit TIM50 n=1 Tax=Polychaeton citri CBS 116435 TaxID=1314669 RepID=A0A9P4PZQ2_9PEZI|nr:HAD-like protein [Polychaeton citri CBS 116435]
MRLTHLLNIRKTPLAPASGTKILSSYSTYLSQKSQLERASNMETRSITRAREAAMDSLTEGMGSVSLSRDVKLTKDTQTQTEVGKDQKRGEGRKRPRRERKKRGPKALPPDDAEAGQQPFDDADQSASNMYQQLPALNLNSTQASSVEQLPFLNPQAAAFQPLARAPQGSIVKSDSVGTARYQGQPSRLVKKKTLRILRSCVNSSRARNQLVSGSKSNTINRAVSSQLTESNRTVAFDLRAQLYSDQKGAHSLLRKDDLHKTKEGAHVKPKSAPDPLQHKAKSTATKSRPYMQLLPRPSVSDVYSIAASAEPSGSTTPQQLLIILDLNGTLLHRSGPGGSAFKERPFCKQFLGYLLEHHTVLVWSSAQPVNVNAMCDRLFSQKERSKLVGVWARDQLRLTPAQYNLRVQVYKQLSWVWNDPDVQMSHPGSRMNERWGQHNTVLIDDSVVKAAAEPWNLVEVEEFEGREDQKTTDVLGQVVTYIEWLRSYADVSSVIKRSPFKYFPDQ